MTKKPYKPTTEETARWAEIEALPISVRYPIRRKTSLARCLRLRHLMRQPERIGGAFEFHHVWYALKRDQMLLVKLRIWRTTGKFPVDN
ncbi:hypothetical protein C7G42_22195 [Bradyrhizobium sp. MOS003]|jgi:hypothetical protein|nr:hypothetical protein C7G42_22195 [Bradyrhizobium sp. MOS003]